MATDASPWCTLGELELHYVPGEPLLQVLDGHGVCVIGRYSDGCCGVIERACDTLIVRGGGVLVEPGDRILHNATHCAEGLDAAEN